MTYTTPADVSLEPIGPDQKSPDAPPVRSAAAERMRRYRRRRRQQLRCFVIQLREAEVNAMICQGLLKRDGRNRLSAVGGALYLGVDRDGCYR